MKTAVVLAGILLALMPAQAKLLSNPDLKTAIDQADFVGVVEVVSDELVEHGEKRAVTPLLVKQRLRGSVTATEFRLIARQGDSRSLVGESRLRAGMTLLAFLDATEEEGFWTTADSHGLIRISGTALVSATEDREGETDLAATCLAYVRESLQDPDIAVQRSALEALVELENREAGPQVIELSRSADPVVAARSLTLRLRSGDLDALPQTIEMIETPGLLPDREALPLIRAIQKSALPLSQLNQSLMAAQSPLLRKGVALSVVGRRDDSSMEALIHCLSYPDPDTNHVCIMGLDSITKGRVGPGGDEWYQDGPAAVRAWQSWWESRLPDP